MMAEAGRFHSMSDDINDIDPETIRKYPLGSRVQDSETGMFGTVDGYLADPLVDGGKVEILWDWGLSVTLPMFAMRGIKVVPKD